MPYWMPFTYILLFIIMLIENKKAVVTMILLVDYNSFFLNNGGGGSRTRVRAYRHLNIYAHRDTIWSFTDQSTVFRG